MTDQESKVSFAAEVLDVQSSYLVTDKIRVVVGSAPDCDFVIPDPLVAPHACAIEQDVVHDDLFLLETIGDGRVCVNDTLASREMVGTFDTISIGCHTIKFGRVDDDGPNRRGTVDVDDVCEKLIASGEVPGAFLRTCPSWSDRRRATLAAGLGTAIALLVILFYFVRPTDDPVLEQVIRPLEVVIVRGAPSRDKVRSLNEVDRQEVLDSPATTAPDLTYRDAKALETPSADPILNSTDTVPEPNLPTRVNSGTIDTGPSLQRIALSGMSKNPLKVNRYPTQLKRRASPRRRLTVTEASQAGMQGRLGPTQLDMEATALAGSFQSYSEDASGSIKHDPGVRIDVGKQVQLTSLQRYRPSPVAFEAYRGTKIPIARIPRKLSSLEEPKGDGVVIDGIVSDWEVETSWKSGQFRQHTAASPPPKANPPTFCYIAKTRINDKPYLYVSFICKDSNLNKLVVNDNGYIHKDDSIEIYLDIDFDRDDYHQINVNSKGRFWSGYYESASHFGTAKGPHKWNCAPMIKTGIDRVKGHWTCEVLIGFDKLAGEPKTGTRWAVNFCRNYRGQVLEDHSHWQTWFLVYEDGTNYHHPKLFGVFQW